MAITKKLTTANFLSRTIVPYIVFFILLIVTSCGSGGVGSSPQDAPVPFKPFLSLHVCLDNTLSYPVQFQHEALQNLASRLSSYISPGMAGSFVDVSLIETNSLQDTLASFSTQAIENIPPKPQPGSDPYAFSKALSDWKKTVAKINALVASVRASIQPSLDTLLSFHKVEVGGTDIPGCADSAAAEFSHHQNGNLILTYISDMQSNIDVNFSKHINLYGAKVVILFMPCQVESACEQLKAFYTRQFKAWNASTVEFYSPAESETQKITGF